MAAGVRPVEGCDLGPVASATALFELRGRGVEDFVRKGGRAVFCMLDAGGGRGMVALMERRVAAGLE